MDGANNTTIEKFAFENCRSLSSVTIPASVSSIGFHAFADCYICRLQQPDEPHDPIRRHRVQPSVFQRLRQPDGFHR
ncbi:MAG: leucine-rich repeat protein [Acidaminococcaceae bacterium]|nr:leucine-rich repeat protein [Acidaminococcaceae bacterium]